MSPASTDLEAAPEDAHGVVHALRWTLAWIFLVCSVAGGLASSLAAAPHRSTGSETGYAATLTRRVVARSVTHPLED